MKRSWIKQGRPPRLTATAILALVWLGAVLAVLQGFASSGPPSGVDASLVAHVTAWPQAIGQPLC